MIRFAGRFFDVGAERVYADDRVTREDLVALAGMPRLRALNLNTAAIGDDDLEAVGRLVGLQDLDVSTTDITDAGVRHLSGLTDMRHLRIKETRVTDAGLRLLAPMGALETVNLRRLDISDEGLRGLAERHRCLDTIVISDEVDECRFTVAGLAEVQRLLPACEIVVVGRGTFPHI
ncbi:hypothetical protein Caci_6624 [Catenulispora acidiphila DSM 44928]|uniref:Leucine Rich repeats (2 copies) n=1 Tax=Catenulispora acidiphila (strain DSM 44928 / JCM 14897 / NBRC 102108 / NRRL B-24433 / ID139908) TaxID=479433 RepID=C7PZX7_CATAD|nr:hypothetical protein [Catenulispora acidiphila]ACU75470.1 hypothetical protein Caci_6624 [Catenulispora acidiphila DSM 44928]